MDVDIDVDGQSSLDEANEAKDIANPLFLSYKASDASEAKVEDALFQPWGDDSNIKATYKAVDIDIDMDIDRVEVERLFGSKGELHSKV